jgi:mono/diheme cytochrome c family protein
MNTWLNVVFGLSFLGLALVNTLLMYYLWGFPYDKATHRSAAPRRLVLTHRATGYAYLAIYIYLMGEMLPRLWHYQIELPPRSVIHLVLGLTIGIVLLIKIVIVRYFKHMESTLIPMLGTALLICTTLLVGLSVPFVFKEQYMNQQAFGSVMAPENLVRIKALLPRAGFPDGTDLDELASIEGLQAGRRVLLSKCVQCHDLRTVLARPKTPEAWLQTVNRMADRAVIGRPIGREERWRVAAYLVAISPELQQALVVRREQDMEVQAAIESVGRLPAGGSFDPDTARGTFEAKCAQCHVLPTVPTAPAEEIKELVARMTRNGLVATPEELAQIVFHLSRGASGQAAPAAATAPASAPPPSTRGEY